MARFRKPQVMSVDALMMVKGLAISLVVANHSGLALPFNFLGQTALHGGLNVLLLVSGISMATFAFNRTTPQTLQAFRRFTLRLVIPSFFIALVWGIIVSQISLPELTFIRNWIDPHRVVSFPIRYVQVILQLMIVFALVFWLLDLTPKIKEAPVRTTAIALILCLLANLISHALWDTSYLVDKLPHLLAWNFVLGWFFWALAVKNPKTIKTRLILSGTLIACEIPTLLLNDTWGGERFLWLTLFGFILIWLDTIALPAVLARIVLLVSQATFFVFLFHYFAFYGMIFLARPFDFGEFMSIPAIKFINGVVIPVLMWAFVTAIMRTYKKMGVREHVINNWTLNPFRRRTVGQL